MDPSLLIELMAALHFFSHNAHFFPSHAVKQMLEEGKLCRIIIPVERQFVVPLAFILQNPLLLFKI